MSADEFSDVILNSFSEQYQTESAYSVSKIFLPALKPLAASFCDFSMLCANEIDSISKRNDIFSLLMNDVKNEYARVYSTDMFVDVHDAVKKLNSYMQDSTLSDSKKSTIQQASSDMSNILNSCVLKTIQMGKSIEPSISVFFTELTAPGVCAPNHSLAYIKDSGYTPQSSFVNETNGWIPTFYKTSSLLDKIFYTSY
jgi:hypothetical protein